MVRARRRPSRPGRRTGRRVVILHDPSSGLSGGWGRRAPGEPAGPFYGHDPTFGAARGTCEEQQPLRSDRWRPPRRPRTPLTDGRSAKKLFARRHRKSPRPTAPPSAAPRWRPRRRRWRWAQRATTTIGFLAARPAPRGGGGVHRRCQPAARRKLRLTGARRRRLRGRARSSSATRRRRCSARSEGAQRRRRRRGARRPPRRALWAIARVLAQYPADAAAAEEEAQKPRRLASRRAAMRRRRAAAEERCAALEAAAAARRAAATARRAARRGRARRLRGGDGGVPRCALPRRRRARRRRQFDATGDAERASSPRSRSASRRPPPTRPPASSRCMRRFQMWRSARRARLRTWSGKAGERAATRSVETLRVELADRAEQLHFEAGREKGVLKNSKKAHRRRGRRRRGGEDGRTVARGRSREVREDAAGAASSRCVSRDGRSWSCWLRHFTWSCAAALHSAACTFTALKKRDARAREVALPAICRRSLRWRGAAAAECVGEAATARSSSRPRSKLQCCLRRLEAARANLTTPATSSRSHPDYAGQRSPLEALRERIQVIRRVHRANRRDKRCSYHGAADCADLAAIHRWRRAATKAADK